MYCSQDDLVKRFGTRELIDLTDRDEMGTIDAARISEVIAEAESVINGYLQGRVQLPLIDVPASLERIACDITRYYLYTDSRPEVVDANFKTGIAFLKDIAAGKVNLGVADSQADPQPVTNSVAFDSGDKVFGRKDSKGFI